MNSRGDRIILNNSSAVDYYSNIIDNAGDKKTVCDMLLTFAILNTTQIEKFFLYMLLSEFNRDVNKNIFEKSIFYLKKNMQLKTENVNDAYYLKMHVNQDFQKYMKYNDINVVAFQQTIIKVINKNLPHIEQDNKKFKDVRHIIKHTLQCIQFDRLDVFDQESARFFENLGNYFKFSEIDSRQALKFYEKSLQIYKNIHADIQNSDVSNALNKIGICYKDLSQYQKALSYLEMSMNMKKEICMDDHPDIAASMNNCAICYAQLRNHRKALELLQDSLGMCKRIYKHEKQHVDVAVILSNIANCYSSLGEFKNALMCQLQSLDMKKKTYKESDHPSLVASLGNIGSAYSDMGEFQKALDYKIKALEMSKRIYKDDHPYIASCFNNIAYEHKNLGEFQEAIDFYFKDLEMCKRIYKEDFEKHTDVAITLNNISVCYIKLNMLQTAIDYKVNAFNVYEKNYKIGNNEQNAHVNGRMKSISNSLKELYIKVGNKQNRCLLCKDLKLNIYKLEVSRI